MKIIVGILIGLLPFYCKSQDEGCNRSTKIKSLSKRIPKGVCLKVGLEFSYAYEDVDLNGDGLKDFITQVRPKNIRDGDTLLLHIYFQSKNGQYSTLKVFNNIYPTYFKDYSLGYTVTNPRLNELQGKFGGTYPLGEIEFHENLIVINLKPGAIDHYALYYRFNKQDWYLERKIYSEENSEGVRQELANEYSWEKKISLSQFNYFDYL